MRHDAETAAILIANQIRSGNFSAAAYALARVSPNRRTLVRLRTERLLTEVQCEVLAQCLKRFDPDVDVDQGPSSM